MRILLDTNIIIHREASTVVEEDIGYLFRWLDRIGAEKCVHMTTVEELQKHLDANVRDTMEVKLQSYNLLKTEAPFGEEIQKVSDEYDINQNDINDSKILNEVLEERVDILISEDRKIHKKAEILNMATKVFTIDTFLEKVTTEHPELVD